MSVLSEKRFHDEKTAYAWVEARVWPNGPNCPHCGCIERIGKLKGNSTRIGVYKCYNCRKPFSVKVGTIFEGSHIDLHVWLQAMYLIASSKKGISSNQLHRTLGVTLKSAWFLSHRIREAMKPGGNLPPLGGEGKIAEADETFIGNKSTKPRHSRGGKHMEKVFSLVERGGKVRSFHVDSIKAKTLMPIIVANLNAKTRLMTDEANQYIPIGKLFASHESVQHSAAEYARGDVSTNTIEGFFSIFKRGMKGIYQHCNERHLARYLAEFDFRYNERGVSDSERAESLLQGVKGKRLTYKVTNQAA